MNKKIMVSSLGFVLAAFAMSGIAFAQEASSSKAAPETKAPAEVVRPAPKEVAPKENAGEKKLKKDLPSKEKKNAPGSPAWRQGQGNAKAKRQDEWKGIRKAKGQHGLQVQLRMLRRRKQKICKTKRKDGRQKNDANAKRWQ